MYKQQHQCSEWFSRFDYDSNRDGHCNRIPKLNNGASSRSYREREIGLPRPQRWYSDNTRRYFMGLHTYLRHRLQREWFRGRDRLFSSRLPASLRGAQRFQWWRRMPSHYVSYEPDSLHWVKLWKLLAEERWPSGYFEFQPGGGSGSGGQAEAKARQLKWSEGGCILILQGIGHSEGLYCSPWGKHWSQSGGWTIILGA